MTQEQMAWGLIAAASRVADALPYLLAGALILGAFWLGLRRKR